MSDVRKACDSSTGIPERSLRGLRHEEVEPPADASCARAMSDLLTGVGVHARMRFFGSHDWYLDGAKKLMKSQTPEGSLGKLSADHCAALLFLMKASATSLVPLMREDAAAGK